MSVGRPILDALLEGAVLGALFFGGLWWTVRRGLLSSNPALWFGLSAPLRLAFVVAGLYHVARGGLVSLLAALLGLLGARLAITRLMQPRVIEPPRV